MLKSLKYNLFINISNSFFNKFFFNNKYIKFLLIFLNNFIFYKKNFNFFIYFVTNKTISYCVNDFIIFKKTCCFYNIKK